MAKTQAEKIEELSRESAIQEDRLFSVRQDLEKVAARGQQTDESLHEVRRHVAVIEERLNEMKRTIEESGRRQWSVVPTVIGVVLGGMLTFLFQVAIRKLFP